MASHVYIRRPSFHYETRRKDAYVEIDVFDAQSFQVSFETRFDVAVIKIATTNKSSGS